MYKLSEKSEISFVVPLMKSALH